MVYCNKLRCIYNECPSHYIPKDIKKIEPHWNCVIITFNCFTKYYDKSKCILHSKECPFWKPKEELYYRDRSKDEPMDWRYHYYGSLMIYDHVTKEWIHTVKNDDRI